MPTDNSTNKLVRIPQGINQVSQEICEMVNRGNMNQYIIDAMIYYNSHYVNLLPISLQKISEATLRQRQREILEIPIDEQMEELKLLTKIHSNLIRMGEFDAKIEDYQQYYNNLRKIILSFHCSMKIKRKVMKLFKEHFEKIKKSKKRKIKIGDMKRFKYTIRL